VTVGVTHFLADLHIEAKSISKLFQTNIHRRPQPQPQPAQP
jgi:hypothetical protein